ncbi:alpha/beta hydrolase [Chitinophaga barathri]|uniref:Alpha/beta hydrolase n=1 Tax=Chitinophaga barathri TaxID=1647451 RepID=A0A3N4M8H1_9BACT|nr:alpha/beta hydrolase [Chitinophaga barathri]RPD39924.1 alpha/beta hydrolase [Chitinophaga barathri]
MRYLLLLVCCCMTIQSQAQQNWFIPRFYRWLTGGPSFHPADRLPSGPGRMETTVIDTTFVTYVRLICTDTRNTGDGNYTAPCNCSDRNPTGARRDTVETEIMFISQVHNKVIVINYLKNKHEKVYSSSSKLLPAADTPKVVDVNVYKLNQIRFGNLKNGYGDTLYFRVNAKDNREEYWDLADRDSSSKEVEAVRIAVPDGFEYKATGESLVLMPLYEKQNSFNLIFQKVRIRDDKSKGETLQSKDCAIHVDLQKKEFYFVFRKNGEDMIIRFKKNRLYSYFNLLPGCKECTPNFLCVGFLYDRFNLEKRKVIADNWYEFAGENLETHLPCGEDSVVNLSLRLDGAGCVYPASINNNDFQSIFLDDKPSRKNLRSRTFYSMMRYHDGMLDSRLDTLCDTLQATIEPYAKNPACSSDTFLLKFRQIWNDRYLKAFADSMKKVICKNNIRRVVFFIHGYNVPYSVAHLQGNDLIRDFMSECRLTGFNEKVLFVRVFWPSNDAKTLRFSKNGCTIKDDVEPGTGKLYNYITNTAYLASLTIRQLMKDIDPTLQVNIISHSFGATVAAGTVLHPIQKMKDTCSHLNRYFVKAFRELPPLPQKTFFFMNAPGMPGVTTFNTISPALNAQHFFYIGYNDRDRVLLKKFLGPIPISPSKKSSTTLGCNYRNEVIKTSDSVKMRGMDGHFQPFRTSERTVHDYFCYRQQLGFKDAYRQYVRESYTGAPPVNKAP